MLANLKSIAPRSVAAILALFIAFRFYVWRRYDLLIEASGLPMVPLVNKSWWMRPMANFMRQIANWHRIYDMKLENFKNMNGALTIAVHAPIWSPEPIVNTCDPVVIRHILKDKFDVYVKPESTISCLRDILGNGIFAINHGPHAADKGEAWTLQRKTAAKVFTNNNFKSLMFETFSAHSQKVVRAIESKLRANADAPIELQAVMYKYTLDSIGVIGFGIDINSLSQDFVPFAHAFDRAQVLSAYRFISPLWFVWPFGQIVYSGERELKGHIKLLDDFVYDIITKRKQELQRGDNSKGDILTLFLQEKLGLTDLELRDVVMSFLIAGRDTTACTLSFALMLLAEHPDWQEKLRKEVKQKLGSKKPGTDRVLDSADISQMKLLQNVVLETLRLYPPVPVDIKCAAVDDVLPGGFKVPKGTRVSFDPYIMGRLEQFWGKDCDQFNPDRWLAKTTLPSAYEFPQFQAGPRICLGESLAKFEAALLLGVLVDRFELSLPTPETKYTYAPGITLTVKGGLYLKVKPISAA